MKYTFLAGLAIGAVITWALLRPPPADTSLLDALTDSVEVAHDRSRADSLRLVAVDDSLRAYRDSATTEIARTRDLAATARFRAHTAEMELRAALDSIQSIPLEVMIAAHKEETAALRAEIQAINFGERFLLQRIAAGDTVISSLRQELSMHDAVIAEQARINDRLRGQLRWAKVRERVSQGALVAAVVWGVVK